MFTNDTLKEHYKELRPQAYIELSQQIQQLYDGPWVQTGNYPDDGCNNPNPSDMAMARKMWRNAYMKLKPYETFIYADVEDAEACNQYYNSNNATQALWAMRDICEQYHNVVELWDEIEQDTEEVKHLQEGNEDWDDIDVACGYYEALRDMYYKIEFPEQKKCIDHWCSSLDKQQRSIEIINKKDRLKTKVIESGFIIGYVPSDSYIDDVEEEEYYRQFADEDTADALHDMARYSSLIADMMDDELGVQEEKIANHIYKHKTSLSPMQIKTFLNYAILSDYLDRLEHSDYDTAETNSVWRDESKQVVDAPKGKPIKETQKKELILKSAIFSSSLRNNIEASKKLIEILKEIDPDINKSAGARTDKWKWIHVRDAFVELSFVSKGISPKDFGTVIHSILPNRTASSISKSCKPSYVGNYYPSQSDTNIISDIVELLKPVSDLINQTSNG